MSSRTRQRRWVLRIIAMLIGTLVALVLCEVILRLLWVPPSVRTDRVLMPDPVYGAVSIPGKSGLLVRWEFEHPFRHTAQGFRGDQVFARARPAGVRRRVLFLGDSFTWGHGAADEEAFVARLAAQWADTEVANTGCSGYGQKQELAVLHHFGAAFRPDLTVLVFFWNDLLDNFAPGPEFDSADGKVVRKDSVPERDPLAPLQPIEMPRGSRMRPYVLQVIKEGTRSLRHRWFGVDREPFTEARSKASWSKVRKLIGLLADRAKELETKLAVVVLPDYAQVDPAARRKGSDPREYDVQDKMAAICAEKQVACVDLLPGIRARFEASGEQYFYYLDRHLTPAGNRIVAELLRPRLEEMLKR